jgi:hypothetical protein
MGDPCHPTPGIALRIVAPVAFAGAPIGRPRQRQNVVIEIPGPLAIGMGGGCKGKGSGQHKVAHFPFSFTQKPPIRLPDFPENEKIAAPAAAVFPARERFVKAPECVGESEEDGPMSKPLMAKATAVWLVDNTTLTFKQVADFCGLHELEVQGIADGDVATGVKGFDPVGNNQLDAIEIERGEKDPLYKLKLKFNAAAVGEEKRRGPRYTPLSKRQDRPAAILWLVKFHPELSDGAVGKLVGTTKPTIQAIRERTHWNINNITPIDPVALGLCKQSELDTAVQAAARKKAAEGSVMSDDERRKLVSTEQSLGMTPEARVPSGFEVFGGDQDEDKRTAADFSDADSFFNLPDAGDDEDEDDDDPRR